MVYGGLCVRHFLFAESARNRDDQECRRATLQMRGTNVAETAPRQQSDSGLPSDGHYGQLQIRIRNPAGDSTKGEIQNPTDFISGEVLSFLWRPRPVQSTANPAGPHSAAAKPTFSDDVSPSLRRQPHDCPRARPETSLGQRRDERVYRADPVQLIAFDFRWQQPFTFVRWEGLAFRLVGRSNAGKGKESSHRKKRDCD
jgi:hypothetical protein